MLVFTTTKHTSSDRDYKLKLTFVHMQKYMHYIHQQH
jgi:hypothetical protein